MIVAMRQTTMIFLVVVAVLAVHTDATEVKQCGDSKTIKSTTELKGCDRGPCKLKKGSTTGITQIFTPDHDINELITRVSAKLLFWIPFQGVDNTSACPKIYHASDDSFAGCPLKKGVTYIYKSEIPVESYYPSVSPRVWWALQENGNDITCFEVEAEISS